MTASTTPADGEAPAAPQAPAHLEQAVPGGVRTRRLDLLAGAHDASHYRLVPSAVVVPRDAGEVGALLRAASQHGDAITFRSGGTSLSGQAVTDEVLVDVRHHFRDITVLDDGARVRAQPGATVRAVNARLARHGVRLGPDPASEIACTIGGVVANNSSGMLCGTHANTYRTLDSAVLVLPSGTVVDTGAEDADAALERAEPGLHAGLVDLRDRVRGDAASVATIERLFALKNTLGYGVNSFLDHDSPVKILEHLAIGSEGTLAFVAEATFRTVPAPAHAATSLLVFPTLADAAASVPALVAAGFATVELLDAASLRVARADPAADELLRDLEVTTQAALLVELQTQTADDLADRLDAAGRVLSDLPLAGAAEPTTDALRRANLWRARKGLYATVARHRPSGTTALLEDVAVPVDALAATCAGLSDLFGTHGYGDSVIFGHARDGNLHFMLTEQFGDRRQRRRFESFTEDLVSLILGAGGTLKAEHGTGRVMAPYVRRQYGDELFDVMVATKRLVDPRGVLNPGVLIESSKTRASDNLKSAPTVEAEVDACVECGYCEPICPSRDLTLTPRQRIVLRRETVALEEAGDHAAANELHADYAYDGLDTCAVDGLCSTSCPVGINTGDLVRHLRAESAPRAERLAWSAAARSWGPATRLASGALTVAKALPAPLSAGVSALSRGLLGKGVPRWSADLPRGGGAPPAETSGTARPAGIWFSACIQTMFGPEPGGPGVRAALAALCDRAGVTLDVPDHAGSLCCGTPWKSKGMTDGLGIMRERVAAALWEATEYGRLPVVVDAASCTEGLRALLDASADLPTPLVVLDAVAFADEVLLPKLEVTGRLDRVVVHPTCSSVHLATTDALLRVAAACAEEVVVPDDWGCCGFAGDRGLMFPELTASATAPEAAHVPADADAWVSCNRTCELGMTRATGHPYRHVLEVLDQVTRPVTEGAEAGVS